MSDFQAGYLAACEDWTAHRPGFELTHNTGGHSDNWRVGYDCGWADQRAAAACDSFVASTSGAPRSCARCGYSDDDHAPVVPASSVRVTEVVRANDLRPGDVLKQLPGATADRCAIEDIRDWSGGVWVKFAFASRRCTMRCYDDPTNCPHMDGSAGGGSQGIRGDVLVERYKVAPR